MYTFDADIEVRLMKPGIGLIISLRGADLERIVLCLEMMRDGRSKAFTVRDRRKPMKIHLTRNDKSGPLGDRVLVHGDGMERQIELPEYDIETLLNYYKTWLINGLPDLPGCEFDVNPDSDKRCHLFFSHDAGADSLPLAGQDWITEYRAIKDHPLRRPRRS